VNPVVRPLAHILELNTRLLLNKLSRHVADLEASDLERPAPHVFPIEGGESLLGCLAFLVQHDSYHLGQVAFLRRYLGFEAMSYK